MLEHAFTKAKSGAFISMISMQCKMDEMIKYL